MDEIPGGRLGILTKNRKMKKYIVTKRGEAQKEVIADSISMSDGNVWFYKGATFVAKFPEPVTVEMVQECGGAIPVYHVSISEANKSAEEFRRLAETLFGSRKGKRGNDISGEMPCSLTKASRILELSAGGLKDGVECRLVKGADKGKIVTVNFREVKHNEFGAYVGNGYLWYWDKEATDGPAVAKPLYRKVFVEDAKQDEFNKMAVINKIGGKMAVHYVGWSGFVAIGLKDGRKHSTGVFKTLAELLKEMCAKEILMFDTEQDVVDWVYC